MLPRRVPRLAVGMWDERGFPELSTSLAALSETAPAQLVRVKGLPECRPPTGFMLRLAPLAEDHHDAMVLISFATK